VRVGSDKAQSLKLLKEIANKEGLYVKAKGASNPFGKGDAGEKIALRVKEILEARA